MTANQPYVFIQLQKWELKYILDHMTDEYCTVRNKLQESYDNLC